MPYRVHLCSFSDGLFEAKSPNGKQGLLFEDSDRFGPSKVHPRSGDLTEVPAGLRWFWAEYPRWRLRGRPTRGEALSAPIGEIRRADFTASGIETEGHDPEEGHGAEHESPTAESGDAQ
jgi:hypothetical protein